MRSAIEPAKFPEPLRPLAAKVRDGVRLDEADALLCFETPHVLHLGRLADAVRRELHGDVAFYNVNRHINPTNVCVYTYNCKFCSFAALKGEDHAWEMSHEDVYAHAANQGGNAVTEFHIVGGLHPDLSLDWYLEMLRGLKTRFPNAHLKAFTAIEVGWFAKREKISIEEVLRRMRDAGLGSLPGGGAEIFHPEVREIICDGKLDAQEWDVFRAMLAAENGVMAVLRGADRRRRQGVAGEPGQHVSVVCAKRDWETIQVNTLDDEVFATPVPADVRARSAL